MKNTPTLLLTILLPVYGFCNDPIVEISFGTYFGECYGYCEEDTLITSSKVTFQKRSTIDDLEEKKEEIDFDSIHFEEIANSIDLIEFKNLPETIGCPDCVDQGGHWFTVETVNWKKKINYEKGEEPSWITTTVDLAKEVIRSNQSSHTTPASAPR